jgi:flagellar hook-associated protein 3 FlgL
MRIARTTHHGLSRILQRNNQRLSEQIRTAEQQAITGLKINRPSDGPSEMGRALMLQGIVEDQGTYQSNAVQAIGLLSTAEQALASTTDVLERAKELALAGANGSWNADDRDGMAAEVEQLASELVALANTRHGSRYVFSGRAYDTEAFDSSGTYGGEGEEPTVQVSANQWASVGFSGSDVFQGEVDLFAVLDDLKTALEDNDIEAVQNTLTDLDTGHNQVVGWRESVGHAFSIVEDAEIAAGNVETLLGTELADLVGVDEVEVYTRLAELRANYDAAARVAGTSTQGCLFEFI